MGTVTTNKKPFYAFLLFALSMLAIFSAGHEEIEDAALTEKNEVIVRLEGGDWGLPTPYRHYRRGPGIFKMQLIYDSLMEVDEKGDIPWLAKSWEIADNGLTYRFNLQEDVLWHDGERMTAADVAFTFDYYREHPPVYTSLFPGGEYIIQKCLVLDDYTVEIVVNSKDVTYLSKIGNARIIPKHVWENVEDPTAYTGKGAVIGCGPFALDSYSSEQGSYRFISFDRYWGLDRAVDAIEFLPVSDTVLAFENGEIDLLSAPADLLSRYSEEGGYAVESKPSYHCYRLGLNMINRPELLDKTLRKALAYGINRKEILEKVQRGSGVVSSMGYVWQDSSWYNDSIEQYDYDPDMARTLLNGESYVFNLLTGNSAEDIKMAELIKLDLARIGIDVTVESVESKVRDSALRSGRYELLLVNYGGMGGDPDFLRSTYYVDPEGLGQVNYFPGYMNQSINEIAREQARELNPIKRKEIIFELQSVIADEVPMVLLTGSNWNIVYRPSDYDNWVFRYGHNMPSHNKLSFLIR